MTNPKKGRPRKGSLVYTQSGYRARITVEVDGVPVQKRFDLGTKDRAAAKAKLRALVRKHAPAEPEATKKPLTVQEYGQGWVERREQMGIAAASYERRYLERVWYPAIGKLALRDVGKAELQEVLDDAATGKVKPAPRRDGAKTPERYGRQSISHMRATIVRLFKSAWKDELVQDNRAERTEVPDIEQVTKPRAVLDDAEIARLLKHPEGDAEIKLLVLLSRTIGGLRAGDLNSLDWTAFGPGFTTCTFIRRKTRKKKPTPQTLVVPEPVRPFIEIWHQNQGCPPFGPVFPVRKGKRAGQAKKRSNMSYADRLRRELIKAGVTRHELHHETSTTLPVDFHSTRRAYGTALARVGVNTATAMALTGHSDPKVHQRYIDELTIRELPAPALPTFSADDAKTLVRVRRIRRAQKAKAPVLKGLSVEREMGLEPTTPSLGSSCSTN